MKKLSHLLRLLLLTVVISLILPATPASAALVRCRVDPHFMLSNGDMVTVTLAIDTNIANIRNVHYVLHLPPGVTVTRVIYTAKSDKKAINETYVVYQDSAPGTYVTETVVTTKSAQLVNVTQTVEITESPELVDVTVFSRANGIQEIAVSGYSGQPLFATLSRP
jgi:hypothetical protein